MKYKCPVCFYPEMDEPAQDFNICSCCGTEFENDDFYIGHAQLRQEWKEKGCPWFFEKAPAGWSAEKQLLFGAISSTRIRPSKHFVFIMPTEQQNHLLVRVSSPAHASSLQKILIDGGDVQLGTPRTPSGYISGFRPKTSAIQEPLIRAGVPALA